MNEEQGKANGKKRDLLSPMLFTILILIIFAAVFYHISSRGPLGPDTLDTVWFSYKDRLQTAFVAYQTDHNESLPILDGTYTNTNCSSCRVINVSALMYWLSPYYPEGLHLSASGNDNCGGNASLGCSSEGSYIWIVDTNGNVFSYCAGAGCATNNSGYQDVWP